MGHGLSAPQEPWAVTTLAMATPVIYIDFLQSLVRFAAKSLDYDAATFGNMLKTIGCPFFVLGHASICAKKPALELPDICYMTACSVLTTAFAGAYRKRPIPEAVFISGLLFFGAYLPLRWQLLDSKKSALVPTIAVQAAPILSLVGLTQIALQYRLIKKVPKGPMSMPQAATLAGTFLGIANTIKLLQMIDQKAPQDNVFIGQVLKVVASVTCFTGNVMGLGWQDKRAPSEWLWRATAALILVRFVSRKKKDVIAIDADRSKDVAPESLPQGVSYDRETKSFQANICIGDFASVDTAHQKYLEALSKYASEKDHPHQMVGA
eukprot:gnl/MRDRNA2_/MRDRNA2_34356_c0_seq1.p1 gnl/MRDRNA2_/MRDRNA2_34356_c0~~gnl/MRDRNA2_/MRDRNA2_34356_c0_seq1.p1  ORF type:complete len:322 (+),score=57.51 gnl/MRDRNA2_/MRDRNA2_34356_c0_seq1:74-1039(+)